MDPITHSLVGAVAAKTVGASRRRLWIMAVLGAIPDLDVVANAFGSWAYLFQHRGLSHSAIGLVFQPVVFAFLLAPLDRGRFSTRAFHYSIPIALHLVCDLLTSYGVPLWSPFSLREFSMDLVNPVTIVPMIFMAGGLYWLIKTNRSGWAATRPVWGAWVLYIAVASSGKAYATRLTETQGHMTALPSTVNPLSWRAVAIDGDGHRYHHYSINLWKGTTTTAGSFGVPRDERPVQASLLSPQVREFLDESRWPVVRVMPDGNHWKVEWGTLLFSARGTVRSKLAVRVSDTGNVLDVDRTFGFWDPKN